MAKKEATLLLRIKSAGEEVLESVKSKIEDLAKIGAAAFAALTAIVIKSIDSYKEQEKATNSLSQAMVNQGIYTRDLKDQYLEQATALSKATAFGDENIVQAQAAIQAQIGNTVVTKELTKAILDFATAQKMDVVSAAELVGKSIGSSTNALGRYGIEIDSTASRSDKTANAIDQLNIKFGGQAEAAVQGLGALDKLKNSVGELFEAFGERIAPVIILVANYLNKLANDSTKTAGAIDGLVTVFEYVVKGGLYVVNTLRAVGETIGVRVAGFVEAGKAALKFNFEEVRRISDEESKMQKDLAIKRKEDLNTALLAVDDAFRIKIQERKSQDAALEAQAAANKSIVDQNQFATDASIKMEQMIAQGDAELAQIGATEAQKLAAQQKFLDEKISKETNANTKLALLAQKYDLQDRLAKAKTAEFEKQLDEQKERDRASSLNMIATLSRSNNQTLATIGKAAALTQIAIEGPMAVTRALAAFPPPFNFVAAGAVAAAVAAQAANVMGVRLAEGGIVQARPGGIQATIGEGGQDEAVIPLDKFGGMGNKITINVYGGMLGDSESAHQLALAIDKELLNLRRNNESVAFDRSIS